jgi:hypothetical protein
MTTDKQHDPYTVPGMSNHQIAKARADITRQLNQIKGAVATIEHVLAALAQHYAILSPGNDPEPHEPAADPPEGRAGVDLVASFKATYRSHWPLSNLNEDALRIALFTVCRHVLDDPVQWRTSLGMAPLPAPQRLGVTRGPV